MSDGRPIRKLRRLPRAGGVGNADTEPGKLVSKGIKRIAARPRPNDPPPERKYFFPLEKGWTKQRLIRELALMEKTNTQLAKEYGVTQGAISQFKYRHIPEIEDVKKHIGDELSGLWIAQKAARLAEYQQIVEDVIRLAEDEGVDVDWARVKMAALKSVAEEMGHLPSKHDIQVEAKTTSYVIEGVNLDDV